jgi:NAD(P)-dependent dehydrogenase (short-subunit alcohol dehydrogenase family)
MDSFLAGKTVLITGASGVLGQAANAAAQAAGARTALVDHGQRSTDLRGAAVTRGGIDLSDEQAAVTAVNAIAAVIGNIDILLNIAGGFEWSKVATASVELWSRLYRTNVLSAVGAIKATLPHMASPGLIVNVAAARNRGS